MLAPIVQIEECVQTLLLQEPYGEHTFCENPEGQS